MDVMSMEKEAVISSSIEVQTGARSAFRKEFESFFDTLDKGSKSKKKSAFVEKIKSANNDSSPEKLQDSIDDMMRKEENKKLRRFFMTTVSPVVSSIEEYTKVIDAMVQAWPMPSSLIWGGLKIVLEATSRYISQFEKMKDTLDMLQNLIYELTLCDKIYGMSPYSSDVVQRHIAKTYHTIILFWYRCHKVLTHSWKYVLVSDHKLLKLLETLKLQKEELAAICQLAEATLADEERQNMARFRNELSQKNIDASLFRAAAIIQWKKAEEERELQRQEREDQRLHRERDEQFKAASNLQSLMEKLNAHEAETQLSNGMYECAKSCPGTCEWLKDESSFREWTDLGSDKPIFWLNGTHGVGKSFLCASMISYLNTFESVKTIFGFLSKDNGFTRNQLLRNFALQLLQYFVGKPTSIPEFLRRPIDIDRDNTAALEELIRVLLCYIPTTYIFIDGLDEVSYTREEAKASHTFSYLTTSLEEDLKAVVTFLANEALQNPQKVRFWCSSQPTLAIQKYLCEGYKSSLIKFSLCPDHTSSDIQKYISTTIKTNYGDDEELASVLTVETLSAQVKGSFLFIASLLEDLKAEAEDKEDFLRLAEGKVPRSMAELYSRTIERIKQRDYGHKTFPLWK
jgi:hypothetical protein